MAADWIDPLAKITSVFIAGVSVAYAYMQYRRAKLWKARDLAAELVIQFEKDEELSLACRALDWGVGPLLVPARYRPLFKFVPIVAGTAEASGEVMAHDPAVLYFALRPSLQSQTLRDPRGLVYRACFDKFFSHLVNMNRLLKDEQIELKDIHEAKYWLEKITSYDYLPANGSADNMFRPFILAFGYGGALDLCKAAGIGAHDTAAPIANLDRPESMSG